MQQSEIDLVRRALALRKACRIGVLWAEAGRYWVSVDQFDPFGSRERVSLEALRALVDETEIRECGRKGAAVEIVVEKAEKTCA